MTGSATPGPRTLIVIAGMHRSGTSLLAQIIHAAGAWLGEDIERQPAPSNRSGHWEHAAVWRIHEHLLDTFGQGWGAPVGPLPHRWAEWPEARAARRELTALAAINLTHTGSWAFKDPRVTRLLPLWTDIAGALDADLRVVAGHRGPRSVVASLRNRDAMSDEDAWRLVRQFETELGAFAQTTEVCAIDYDDLLATPVPIIERLVAFCRMTPSPDALLRARRTIQPSLRHQQPSEGETPEPRQTAGPVPSGHVQILLETAWNEPYLRHALQGILAQSTPDWHLFLIAEPPLHPLIRSTLAPYDRLFAGRASLLTPHCPSPRSGTRDQPPVAVAVTTEFDRWAPDLLRDSLAHLGTSGALRVLPDGEQVRTQPNETVLSVTERQPAGVRNLSADWPCIVPWATFAELGAPQVTVRERVAALRHADFARKSMAGRLNSRDIAGFAGVEPGSVAMVEIHRLHPHAAPADGQGLVALTVVPGNDVADVDGILMSTGPDPQVHLATHATGVALGLPPGLYLLRLDIRTISQQPNPRLYARAADGFTEGQSLRLQPASENSRAVLVNAPAGLAGLRVDPSEGTASAARIAGSTLLRLSDPLQNLAPIRRTARLPDVLCIGAQKSATTWLHHHLQTMPGIWRCPIKEFHHFDTIGGPDPFEAQKQRKAFDLVAAAQNDALRTFAIRLGFPSGRGWAAYLDLFADCPPDQIALDFTPAYATLPDPAVAEIAEVMSRTKVVYILRDPVERSLSGARHEAHVRGIVPTPEALAALARTDFNRSRGDYLTTIARWSRHVGPDRFKLLFYDDLVTDPATFLTAACKFIGIACPEAHVDLAVRINARTDCAPASGLAPLAAEISVAWLPQLRSLARDHPHPCRAWLAAALARIRAFAEAGPISPAPQLPPLPPPPAFGTLPEWKRSF